MRTCIGVVLIILLGLFALAAASRFKDSPVRLIADHHLAIETAAGRAIWRSTSLGTGAGRSLRSSARLSQYMGSIVPLTLAGRSPKWAAPTPISILNRCC
jgi:hypothetical protein